MAERVYPISSQRSNHGPPAKVGIPPGAYHNGNDLKQPRQAPLYYYGEGGRYNNSRPRRRNACCLCLAWLGVIVVALLVLIGIAVLTFFLIVHPKAPKYDVQDVRLSMFAITPVGTLSSGIFRLDAVTTYTVQARNPNGKIGIHYDDIQIGVVSDSTSIGKGSVPAFYQGHKNITIISGNVTSLRLPLDSTVGTALQSALNSGRVPLYVTVDVRARVKVGSWNSPHFWVHVRCDVDVNPGITKGSQVLNKKCSVKR